jgi:hypothetical protein
MLVFPQIMTSPTNTPVQHIFSVDVEDYFQVNAFEATVQRSQWTVSPAGSSATWTGCSTC